MQTSDYELPAAPQPPRRFPRRQATIALEGAYDGFTVQVWVNPPLRILEELDATTSLEAQTSVFAQLITGWNLPFPTPSEGGSLADLPIDVFTVLARKYSDLLREQVTPKTTDGV